MTSKPKRAKRKKFGPRAGRIARLRASASVEDELLRLAEGEAGGESRWNRPQKQRLAAGGLRGGGLVEGEEPGLPDADQPDPAER